MNNVKVFGLMALMTGLVVAVAGALGGQNAAVIALLMAGVMNFVMYFVSGSMVLKMYGAKTIERHQAPELYDMVDRLRQRAGLPMPTVAIAPQEQPNAFATGRNYNNAVVCVTAGLMRLVNREELEGVIAHELAHIKNRDMLLQTFTATMAGAISYLAQMAISRQREYKADAVGAEICGRPLALAGALEKLEMYARRIPMNVSPAAAPVAQVNPLAAHGGGMARLFTTHPPTEKRIEALRRLAAGR